MIQSSKAVVIIYQKQFKTLLKESISGEWKILEWLPAEDIDENTEQHQEVLHHYKNSAICQFIIMVSSREMKTTVMHMLNVWEIESAQILDVYKAYLARFPLKRYQRIMERKNVCNLCESSQDIYFNYKVLKNLYEEYYEQIRD